MVENNARPLRSWNLVAEAVIKLVKLNDRPGHQAGITQSPSLAIQLDGRACPCNSRWPTSAIELVHLDGRAWPSSWYILVAGLAHQADATQWMNLAIELFKINGQVCHQDVQPQ
jgi:hypothetical protein